MFKHFLQKFYGTCNYILIYQMTAMPLALAGAGANHTAGDDAYSVNQRASTTSTSNVPNSPTNNQINSNQSSWNNAASIGTQLGQFMNTALGAYTQASQQFDPRTAQIAGLRISPIDNRQIPKALSGCLVLPAKGNRLPSALECSADKTASYIDALINRAELNSAYYDNYIDAGNERYTTQGIGCYNKKLEGFNAKLIAREKELDKYRKRIKRLLDNFTASSKGVLEGIKATSAILNGGEADNKYVKDFKFENLFLGNDPGNVCASIISAADISTAGKKSKGGGLRGIEAKLFKDMNKPDGTSMSATEVLTKSNQISRDIDKLASRLSSDMNDFEGTELNLSDISYRGKVITKDNAALKAVISEFNSDFKKKVKKMSSSLNIATAVSNNDSGDVLQSIVGNISSGKKIDFSSLEATLSNFENQTKKKCLTDNINSSFSSSESFATSFKDPNITRGLNRDADNAMANSILKMLSNPNDNDINDILARVKTIQQQGTNSNKIMVTGRSFDFTTKDGVKQQTVNASTPLKISQIMGIFVNNCNDNYGLASAGSSYSPRQTVAAVRSFASQRDNLRRTSASTIGTLLKDEMKTCSRDTSTGSAALSCSGALDVSKAGFCLRTATKCASNMKGCYEKASSQITRVKKEQRAGIDAYNVQVNVLKKSLKSEIDAVDQFLEFQARRLDAQLDLGVVSGVPKDDFNLGKEFYLKSHNGTKLEKGLEIQDPKKYMEAALKRVDSMQEVIKEQRIAYIGDVSPGGSNYGGKLGDQVKSYITGYRREKIRWNKIAQKCQGAFAALVANENKMAEKAQKDNASVDEACGLLTAFNNDLQNSEVGSLADKLTTVSVLAAATDPTTAQMYSAQDKFAIARIRSFAKSCATGSEGGIKLPSVGGSRVTALSFCSTDKAKAMYPNESRILCDGGSNSSSLGSTCDEVKFKAAISDSEFDFCREKDSTNIVAFKSGKIDSSCINDESNTDPEVEEADYTNIGTAKKIVKALEAKGKQICSLKGSRNDTNLELLQQLADGYNCAKSQEKAGQISVSFCRPGVASGRGFNAKVLSQTLGTALGQRQRYRAGAVGF